MNKYDAVTLPSSSERSLTTAMAEALDAVNDLTKLVADFSDQMLGPQPVPCDPTTEKPYRGGLAQFMDNLDTMRDRAHEARRNLQAIRNKV